MTVGHLNYKDSLGPLSYDVQIYKNFIKWRSNTEKKWRGTRGVSLRKRIRGFAYRLRLKTHEKLCATSKKRIKWMQ